jgi:hypothetical protein
VKRASLASTHCNTHIYQISVFFFPFPLSFVFFPLRKGKCWPPYEGGREEEEEERGVGGGGKEEEEEEEWLGFRV